MDTLKTLDDVLTEPDPVARYAALSEEMGRYEALVGRIADEKARCAVELADSGMSLQQVADALNLGTRSRAQQLVARGRNAA